MDWFSGTGKTFFFIILVTIDWNLLSRMTVNRGSESMRLRSSHILVSSLSSMAASEKRKKIAKALSKGGGVGSENRKRVEGEGEVGKESPHWIEKREQDRTRDRHASTKGFEENLREELYLSTF